MKMRIKLGRKFEFSLRVDKAVLFALLMLFC
jgi:hypothetical protein